MPRPIPLHIDDLPPRTWNTRVAIRFSHCDPAGIVYTPVYFDLFNGVIEDWFADALQLPYRLFIRDRRIGLGYAHAACDFFQPSEMGDALDVAVVVAEMGRSSYRLTLHAMKNGREAVRGHFVTVTTGMDARKPCPIPDDLRAALTAYQAATG
ncbi:MAG: acyl-CoA thioesterase [Chelatococcus sp.]|uniref:acyl-CoA thioesterase n=1 Tax=unclassified Chelatococcus TaxID=2638111 RepID=UPI001BD12561|nr:MULTISPECIES: thioesterase family protein [unclassified Chelatococcus]CAH1648627.1 4-hydroxybenzoyl-CoA thioesterase/acyl-CoA thioester hydrolase [Hyphomicrobiales bacterium]MBS7741896.1 acyl-CoA thioesterase [Chelatococcus sp. HY11]MBX3538193.1 acyl-CoA thioesterase [Chelatococcus sp.]MBX3541306.1 acyl-CoA thioesterase [Chelatococcus sp.]MCO5074801.1 acyl-CoA thioesterase [Chelatococcus sp.]